MPASRRKFVPPNWKKILYLKQQFHDNYTDSTFLSLLRKNVFLRRYTFSEAALPLCAVTLELCCTFLFVVTFVCLDRGYISCYDLAWYTAGLLAFCVCLYFFTSVNKILQRRKISVRIMVMKGIGLVLCGYVFSPVLKTLTQTISADTVHAMVACMLFIHVTVQDYFPGSKIPYSYLSLNTALFSAVCLASQLHTVEDTFGLTVFAFQIFVFTPCFRYVIQEHAGLLVTFTVASTIFVSVLLFRIKPLYSILFTAACAFINIFCPKLFVKYQIYKENIYGPWDEAIIEDYIDEETTVL